MATAATSTGYGPRHSRLIFNGDQLKYELWELKFLGYLKLNKLLDVINNDNPDADKNADVFAELVQCLDDRSLTLIARDAKDDGKKAIKILREHYLGKSKPRIISLYTELTTLKLNEEEIVTDFLLRAETTAVYLKNAGEIISDSLLIVMILKGLSSEYKTFSTVITQKDTNNSFSEFKVALRSFEETLKQNENMSKDHNIMKVEYKNNIKCYNCNKEGHKRNECKIKINRPNNDKSRRNRWCNICKNTTHDTNYCRKKSSINNLNSQENKDESFNKEEHNFAFNVVHNNKFNVNNTNLLVDCGATAHIINDESLFINKNLNFDSEKHFIELADGSKKNNIVLMRGDAKILLYDVNNKPHDVILKNALCIPSYKQNIFSV